MKENQIQLLYSYHINHPCIPLGLGVAWRGVFHPFDTFAAEAPFSFTVMKEKQEIGVCGACCMKAK
jgi:hypothetical protein